MKVFLGKEKTTAWRIYEGRCWTAELGFGFRVKARLLIRAPEKRPLEGPLENSREFIKKDTDMYVLCIFYLILCARKQ